MTTADETLYALVILLSLVIGVALYIWTALALAAVFRKLGEEAWKGWVPFLNVAIILKWGGFNPWLVLLTLTGIGAVVVWILLIIAAHRLGPGFGYGGGMTVLAALLFVVWASILGFGPARWLGARLAGPPPAPAAGPAGPTPETAALFAPPEAAAEDSASSWMPPAVPAADPTPSADASAGVAGPLRGPASSVPAASGPVSSVPSSAGPASSVGRDGSAGDGSVGDGSVGDGSVGDGYMASRTPSGDAASRTPSGDAASRTPSGTLAEYVTGGGDASGVGDAASGPRSSRSASRIPAGDVAPSAAGPQRVGPPPGGPVRPPSAGAPGEPDAPDGDAPAGPRRTSSAGFAPAPGFSSAPDRDERAPATPASGHVNAQRPAAPAPIVSLPTASPGGYPPREDEGEATEPATADEHVDAWGSEVDEVSAVSPSPFPPSSAGSQRYVGTPVDTTGDPISFVPGRKSAIPTGEAPVTRVPAPEPEEPRLRQWPASHYDPDVFPEMSGEVSAVVGSPAAGAPLSARRSVPAQESEPDTEVDDDFDHTVIARRKRPAWQLIPASGRPIPLTSDVVILGRHPAPDPARPRAQLVSLDDRTRTVSKTHARLELHADGWQLTDLHSTNGVLLPTVLGTEVEIEPGSTVPAGDRFLLGDAELRLTRGDA